MNPELVILQHESTTETRAVRLASLINDIPTVNSSSEGLESYRHQLRAGTCLPVGSVEFIRCAMQAAGIREPLNLSYPEGAQRFLGRSLHQVKVGQVVGTWFVKPLTTKAFTGFVFDTMRDPKAYPEADRESLVAFMAMPADASVWISEPVQFQSEWRYYIQEGKIIGSARYDPTGADDAPVPAQELVLDCIEATGLETPYAADFGVLQGGATVLVEVNDAWGVGLYGKALESMAYLRFLYSRWQSLVAQNSERLSI
jgi:hypothetical protein